ncbi:uncharacterized protein LOC125870109 [Solanum stenotomum]|uniref:uncharacterized protein LOC125870109 n=1 Tax=Solanum stenotomum TaxID=172797 RepID=UPI0020CFFFBE|nr:uncharacterized protein LOC125870109 [Solanum stenotomum]
MVRIKMKKINKKEFMKVSEKVQALRRELIDKQKNMRVGPIPQDTIDEEKVLKTKLAKWSMIEENIYKQKYKVQWLKLGDANNAYFFASMKGMKAQNQINILTSEDETVIRKATVVQRRLEGDVKEALMSIGDSKAPGEDGFNSYFFKKICSLIGEEVAFVPGRMLTDNVLLSHELVKGYGRKGTSPRCFSKVPRMDNELCHDCVLFYIDQWMSKCTFSSKERGETRGSTVPLFVCTSPRCMFKIDMQKAYDSVEWYFLEEVLAGMHVPQKFLGWIMSCVRTVSYSILINGCPIAPFQAKRGVRQGDPMSPYLFVLAMDYFTRLLKILRIQSLSIILAVIDNTTYN